MIGANTVYGLNRAAENSGTYSAGGVANGLHQHFADGGIAGFFSGLVKKGKDIMQGMAAGALQPLANTVKGFINNNLKGDGASGLMRAGGITIVDKLMSWVRGKDKELPAIGSVGGSWPGSPGAQRGDSGIWRRVVEIIKGGPKQGAFGNGYRPGDPKWHGSGRAVDWMGYNMDALSEYLLQKPGQILEFIHRTNKRDYAYTRGKNKGSFSNSLMNAHRNHIHVAMDGITRVQPGPFMGYNATGKPETLVNSDLITGNGGGVNIYGDVHIHTDKEIDAKQIRAQLLTLAKRNGGRSGLPA
jgi:hypothetical protein